MRSFCCFVLSLKFLIDDINEFYFFIFRDDDEGVIDVVFDGVFVVLLLGVFFLLDVIVVVGFIGLGWLW